MRAASVHLFLLIVALAACPCARADILELKNGGTLHGEITNAGDKSAASYVISTDGGGRMTIPRDQVVRIVGQSPQQEEYHRRAVDAADTVDAHWKLAEWCRQQKLVDEYRA